MDSAGRTVQRRSARLLLREMDLRATAALGLLRRRGGLTAAFGFLGRIASGGIGRFRFLILRETNVWLFLPFLRVLRWLGLLRLLILTTLFLL